MYGYYGKLSAIFPQETVDNDHKRTRVFSIYVYIVAQKL